MPRFLAESPKHESPLAGALASSGHARTVPAFSWCACMRSLAIFPRSLTLTTMGAQKDVFLGHGQKGDWFNLCPGHQLLASQAAFIDQ